jgi:adenylate cyclase
VRLVKTIGDAAMLVSPEAEPLVGTLLDLLEASDDADDELPPLRAGAAHGRALPRGGDWYGHPVNLASRVTDAARPGSLLVTRELRDTVRGEFRDGGDGDRAEPYRWSRARPRHFRGIKGQVSVYRARRREPDGSE